MTDQIKKDLIKNVMTISKDGTPEENLQEQEQDSSQDINLSPEIPQPELSIQDDLQPQPEPQPESDLQPEPPITPESLVQDISNFQNTIQKEFNTFIADKIDVTDIEKVSMIPTGIDILDAALGGGIPLGRFVVFAGYPGGGKSTLAAHALSNLQTIYKEKCLSVYLDSEQTMSTFRLVQLGVNKPKIVPKGGVTVEKIFDIIEGICLFKDNNNLVDVPTVVVWDSIANTPTEKDLVAKDVNETIGLKARILSMMLPRIVNKLSEYNITLLAVNQLREKLNIGLFSAPSDLRYMGQSKDMPGGQTVKFNASQLLMLRHKADIKIDQFGFDGAKVICSTIKNKFYTPNITLELALDFKSGFDNFWTNYLFLAQNKLIKTGAWNKLTNYDPKTFRTKEAKLVYNSDMTFKQAFDELTKQVIQEKILDVYNV